MKNLKEKIIIFLFILFSIIFWFWALSSYFSNRTNNGLHPIMINQDFNYIKIDDSLIEIDSTTNRRYISNLINIAIKDKKGDINNFLDTFYKVYSNKFKVNFADTVINRTQITILNKSSNRDSIKAELKSKFASYDLLIWDEVLFSKSSMYNDPIRLNNKFNWHFEAINIEPFWKKYNGNEEIVVAVIDNGFDLNHIDLKDKISLPYNVINKRNINMGNAQNHGTHVASLIAAASNQTGTVGIAPNAKIIPIKVEDDQGYMTSSYIIDGILYAVKNNADVINLSLGFNLQNIVIPENVQKEIIQIQCKDEELFWKELFDYTEKNNVICVLAAGNSSMLTGLDPFQRSPNTIKVGAYDQNNEIASFSNYGEFTNIFAPGEQIIGAKPNNQYELLDGTSTAAPIISGIAAALKSKNKNYNSSNFKTFLNENAIQKNNFKLFKYKNI